MNRAFKRNILIFFIVTAVAFGALVNALAVSNRKIEITDDWIVHTNQVLHKASYIGSYAEGMVNAQRGVIISNSAQFRKTYEVQKTNLSDLLADLSELVADNAAQKSRVDEIRGYYSGLVFLLDTRMEKFSKDNARTRDLTAGLSSVTNLLQNILRVHDDIIDNEQEVLASRIMLLDDLKDRYFRVLIIGGALCIFLMMFVNLFILRIQTLRTDTDRERKESEDRFRLATRGAKDGIFDWDIKADTVFCSGSLFAIIGGSQGGQVIGAESFRKHIHPDDLAKTQVETQKYLNGEMSEYSVLFRMRHSSGRWVWVNMRASALFDQKGQPYRLVGAIVDVTTLKLQNQRLDEAREAAENASRAKSDFLAHMSHEIRTPLTAISGIAEILEKRVVDADDKMKKLVATLSSSTRSLKAIVNDVLDFSKIESGEIELTMDNVNVAEILDSICGMSSVSAAQKGISLKCKMDDVKNLSFYSDQLRLRQILINLLSNAIKFTEKGSVTVEATVVENAIGAKMLNVDVIDTGTGIPANMHELIFERFKQADASISRKYGGTGLGLPISRRLARLMGGDVTVSSVIGVGSTFSFCIPLERQGLDLRNLAELPDPSEELAFVQGGKPNEMRVLVAEDYEGNILILSHFLEEWGYRYSIVNNGLAALDALRESTFNLVLMDIQMPGMDGLTATRMIREMEATNNRVRVPIVGMTAHALAGDRDKCISAGMDDYLPKPIISSELRRILNDQLFKRRKGDSTIAA